MRQKIEQSTGINMKPEIRKLAEWLQLNLSQSELEELAHELSVAAKDEYYKQHPEEVYHA